jgi:hypothetical protein
MSLRVYVSGVMMYSECSVCLCASELEEALCSCDAQPFRPPPAMLSPFALPLPLLLLPLPICLVSSFLPLNTTHYDHKKQSLGAATEDQTGAGMAK